MSTHIYIIVAGTLGILLGLFIGTLLFSKKKEIEDIKNQIKQDRIKMESRMMKAQDDLNQKSHDLQLATSFISISPQIVAKMREQTTFEGIGNLLIIFFEKIFQARQVTFFLYNSKASQLQLAAKKGLPDQIPIGYSIRIGDGKIGWAAQKRMVMNDEDFETETYMVRQQLEKSTTVYFKVDLCAPVTYYEELLGIVTVGNMVKRSKIDKVIIQMIVEILAPFIKQIQQDQIAAKAAQAQASEQAPKERLLDKAQYIGKLDQRVEEAKMMHGSTVTLASIAVDDFHLFVQRNGLNAGEDALAIISNMLLTKIPKAELKAILEESLFSIMFMNINIKEVYSYINAIKNMIFEYGFPIDSPSEFGKLTVSCGIVMFPYHADNLNTLISASIHNSSLAHSAGGNTISPPLERLTGLVDGGEDFLDIEILNALEE